MTCLRPRQMCECLVPTSYDQLRTSPPAFTTLTSMAPHPVTSQAGGLHTMGMPSFGSSGATTWPSMGATSTATDGPCQDSQFSQLQHRECKTNSTGLTMGGVPPSSMGDMPPLRQTHPTTQSQQPCQQATPYTPSCGCASESYLHFQDQYPLGCLFLLLRSSDDIHLYRWTTTRLLYREKNYILLVWVFKAAGPILETALEESAQERTREIPHHW